MDTKLNINAIEELSIPVTKLKDPENLTTGFANDLTGRNEATAEEFTLRPSAGNISIRDDSATIKRIKGNSLAFNQMLKNGDFATATDWSPYQSANVSLNWDNGLTVTSNYAGTGGDPISVRQAIAQPFILGHKYFVHFEFSTSNTSLTPLVECFEALYSNEKRLDYVQSGNHYYSINNVKNTRTTDCYLKAIGTKAVGDTWTFKDVMIIDLTQMFGAGNEPDTVEEFRVLFPGNHYEHNPGQLVSMTANGLFTNGFNQWDEEWVNGYYRIYADSGVGNDGGFVENSSYIATAKPMKVLPNTQYYIKSPYGVLFGECDINGIYTGNHYYVYAGSTFTTSSNCFYLLFYVDKAITNATYNNDICINLSHTGVENGKYEPYWDATKDLSIIQKYFPNGMRSAGSIYDEISFDETTQKWVAIQRVGNVDLGSLSWFASAATTTDNVTNRFFYAQINGLQLGYGTIMISAPYDEINTHPSSIRSKDKTIYCSENYVGGNSPTAVIIRDSSYNDAASFKTAMSGVMLNYELAEPIITVIEEPINLSYKVGDFGVEQILSDSFSAPFRADIIYQFNATDRIRENSLNIEKLSKTQNECLLLAGGTMSGQINSQDIKPVEDSAYQLGDSTHKYNNVFSNFFTGNLEGNAKTASDLTGRIEATPEVFTYHPSAGEKSIKDNNAFIRRVKGNSVVFNQIAKEINSANWKVYDSNNASISFNSNIATVTVMNYASDIYGYGVGACLIQSSPTTPDHKYLIAVEVKSDIAMDFGIELNSKVMEIGFVTNEWTYCTKIATSNRDYTKLIIGPRTSYTAELNTYSFRNLICIDLTQMFGIGNEPTTVEEFRALYPDSYYPYNAGELRNLDCSGIKTVGFNQWDEQWELGTLNSVGENDDTSTTIRSKNYTPAIGGTDYYVGITSEGFDNIYYLGISWYDSNKQFISKTYCNQRVVTSPINAAYFRIFTNTNSYVYGTTYNNDICINLSHTGYRDGEYEPYKEVTHSLPLSQITNGEPLRKARNAYDEINETEYIKRVGVVDLGSLTYSKSDNFPNLFISTPFGAAGADADKIANLFCPKYITMTAYSPWKDIISIGMDTSKQLYIYDPQYTDIEAFKSAMSGVMLNYELAEPIVTPIETPIDFNYYVEDFGTEEALLAEDSAPFSADIVYQFNATDTIRVLEKNIKQLLNKIISLENTIANAITNSNNL